MCEEVGNKMVTCRNWNRCRNPLELEREEGGEKKGRKEEENKIGRRKGGKKRREGGREENITLGKGQMYLLDQGLLLENG